MLANLFARKKPIIGMVHLLPLPGSPKYDGQLKKIIDRAIHDARALEDGGVDGIIIENINDVPYYPTKVPPETIASMTFVASKVAEVISIPIGINVLRRDSIAAMAIAYTIGGRFIRTNILIGAYVTDQGIIEANAHELLRYRAFLGADIKIFADIRVKYASPLYDRPIYLEAEDAAYRGLADAIIISGAKTGSPPDIQLIKGLKEKIKNIPILIGSGVNENNAKNLIEIADGAIIGSFFKKDGILENPVDIERVRKLVSIIDELR